MNLSRSSLWALLDVAVRAFAAEAVTVSLLKLLAPPAWRKLALVDVALLVPLVLFVGPSTARQIRERQSAVKKDDFVPTVIMPPQPA